MDLIFHEKQEGSLCAQHCLNALLQGPYFTPVDLATLAQRMDDEERAFMAESGVDTEEYRTFIQQPSGNMDDSGFFSVQVISSALAVWSLELTPLTSQEPLAVASRENPQDQNAFICNYREHWFTIRKLGNQWFNLNSLLSGPELVSTTYLSILLAQLQQEGYSIFIVHGRLPPCPADEALLVAPAVPRAKPRPKPQNSTDDPELEKAIRMSIAQQDEEDAGLAAALRVSMENDAADDPSLNKAIRLSLSPGGVPESSQSSSTNKHPSPSNSTSVDSEGSDEALLSEAIRLSLEGQDVRPAQDPAAHAQIPFEQQEAVTSTPAQPRPKPSVPTQLQSAPPRSLASDEPNLEEIRKRRLAYLEKRKT